MKVTGYPRAIRAIPEFFPMLKVKVRGHLRSNLVKVIPTGISEVNRGQMNPIGQNMGSNEVNGVKGGQGF